jgi:hypothetical protein
MQLCLGCKLSSFPPNRKYPANLPYGYNEIRSKLKKCVHETLLTLSRLLAAAHRNLLSFSRGPRDAFLGSSGAGAHFCQRSSWNLGTFIQIRPRIDTTTLST